MRGTHGIALDPRLSMIASLVGPCESCADIGCDHGRLGAFLLQSGLCQRVVLTDVSEPSLKKARALIALKGLGERAAFCVGDGAATLPGPVDCAVIAGMGGATVAKIVREGREKLGGARLILQPNVAAPQLRATLCEQGYAISDERVVPDGHRLYVVIAARPGEALYDERELTVGPVLLRKKPPELMPYAQFRLRVARKALKGASAAGDAAQAAPLAREIAIWEEVAACLRR